MPPLRRQRVQDIHGRADPLKVVNLGRIVTSETNEEQRTEHDAVPGERREAVAGDISARNAFTTTSAESE